MQAFIEAIGGRKFAFAGFLTVFAMVLVFVGKMDIEQMKSFLEWIFALFVAGNVAQKFTVSSK